jgi:type I restriction enzyme S subunit
MSTDSARPALHLPARYLAIVQDILRRYLPLAEVWAYGSRVKGDHHDASDLDLVARQPDDLTRPQPDLDEVAAAFSDSDLPILVQIVDWARIPAAFREEIEAGYAVLQAADDASAASTDTHFLAPTLRRGSVVAPLQRCVGAWKREGSEKKRGKMTDSWRDTTIGCEMTLQRGFDITRSQQLPGSVPVVSSGGISSFHDTAMVKGPGVVLGRKGVVGSVYFVDKDYWPHDTTLWVKDFKGNFPRFVYYFFRGMLERIASMDVGSANPTLNRNHVHPIEIRWPPPVQQRAIAGVLGALDDKIEQNRRTARALERLAHAIFRAWFVDFEPVKAKAAGLTAFPSMPQPVFDALPTGFVDSEIGPLPEGWSLKPIATIATFLNGLALQKYPPRGDGKDLPVIKIAELRKGSADKADWANGDVPEQYLINDRDLIFSWSGTLEAELWFGGKGALNQHLFKVTSSQYPSWFCLLWIREHLLWFRTVAASKATTMGHIKRGHLQEARVVVPSPAVLHAANRAIGPLYEQYAQVMVESRTLARLRDYLLPKLLSGEVPVQAFGDLNGEP